MKWYNATLTISETVTKIYLNGILTDSTKFIGHNNSDDGNPYLNIGTSRLKNNRYFNGKIDDVKIYNKVLSTAEIQELYNKENSGLVAYYPFNNNANDESGNNNNGMVNGATLTIDRFGNENSAYSFDGVDDYIDLTSYVSSFNFQEPASFSFWVNTDNDNAQTLFAISDTTMDARITGLFTGNNTTSTMSDELIVAANRRGPGDDYITGFTTTNRNLLFNNNWHHIVYVFGESGTSIYLDNQLLSLTNYKTNTGHYGNINNAKVTIGTRHNIILGGLGAYFKGALDDIRVYNTTLSQTEIEELYNEEKPNNKKIMYGDVNSDDTIIAYDGVLALQYSVCLDPIPSIDTIPWDVNRIKAADVNGIGGITAYDASLIAQYAAKRIIKFPVENGLKSSNLTNIEINSDTKFIYFVSKNNLFALNVDAISLENIKFSKPVFSKTINAIYAQNVQDTIYKLGVAAAMPITNGVEVIKIPYNTIVNKDGKATLKLEVNENQYEVEVSLKANGSTTSIGQQNSEEKVSIYPNPANNYVSIGQSKLLEWNNYEIVDITGKVVLHGSIVNTNQNIKLNNLNNGYYFLKLLSNNKTTTYKLIIAK